MPASHIQPRFPSSAKCAWLPQPTTSCVIGCIVNTCKIAVVLVDCIVLKYGKLL
jgi:hypothetical protein